MQKQKDRNQTDQYAIQEQQRQGAETAGATKRAVAAWMKRHRSHTISGSEGARHKLHHSRGARSSAGSNLAGDEAQVMSL